FAVKGLGALKDPSAVPVLMPLLSSGERSVLIESIRALGRIGDPVAAEPLMRIIRDRATNPAVRLESVAAIGGIRAPGVADTLTDLLSEPAEGAGALADAYRTGQRDPDYPARAAALAALVEYGAAAATPALKSALADKDWAVRVRAARLLAQLDPAAGREAEAQIRPAPTTLPPETYEAPRLVHPDVSTHVYIDT